jgi:hypothetical protein
MSAENKPAGETPNPLPPELAHTLMIVKRTAVTVAVVACLASCVLASAWKSVFYYVAPGNVLIIISKTGAEPPPGQLLAHAGEKGIQEEVLGEGRHFVLPVVNEVEYASAIEIGIDEVGIVKANVGKDLPPGKMLADDGEKGIRRRVLQPGRHRLNPHGYTVERKPRTFIRPGYVGFVTALVGKDMPSGQQFAGEGEKGPRRETLPAGIYYLNPYELKVDEIEVGINQVSFLEEHRLAFPSADAFPISLEATVEWELDPDAVPQVMKEFGARSAIEEKVIVPQATSIGRLAGSRYNAKDFLLGEGREKFQKALTDELITVARAKNIEIHSAFIRYIEIPATLRKPIQEAFIAVQKEKTAKFWEDTRKSAGDLEREKATIIQREQEVAAQTTAITLTVGAQASQDVGKIEAETRRLVAEKQKEIATLDAQRTLLLGQAQASVTKMLGEARAALFGLKVGAFGGDAAAFRHYSFAEALPQDLGIHLVQSGPGTLWTDLAGTAGVDDVVRAKILKGK